MDLKKAKLNDDSLIYKKRQPISQKQQWSQLKGKEKWDFFRDYYLLKLIFSVVIIVILGSVLWSTFGPKPTEILYAVIDGYGYQTDAMNAMQEELYEAWELDPKKESVRIDSTYSLATNQSTVERFTVYVFTGEIDVFIASEEVFQDYVEKGVLTSLTETLPADMQQSLKEHFVTGQIIESEPDGTVTNVGEPDVYGIYLDDFSCFSEFYKTGQRPVVGIVASGTDQENAVRFIRFLFDTMQSKTK